MNNLLKASLIGSNRNYQKPMVSQSYRGLCCSGIGVGGENETAEAEPWKPMVRWSANLLN